MAKKKADTQTESDPHQLQDNSNQNRTMDDAAYEKLESLKSLNALLVKETVERRKQVESLKKSNGNLESELNRSVMDNGVLQSEVSVLTEKAVMLEIEKGLVFVFIISQVNQVAEEIIASLKQTIGSLKGDLKRVLEEKSEIEKSKSEKESEVSELKSKLDELIANIDEERVVSSRVCDERDELRAQLSVRIQEVNELQLKVIEAEKTETRITEEVTELKAKHDELVEQNKINKQRIDSVTSDKDLIEANLVDSYEQIDDLKRNVDSLLKEKKAIEDEKNTHERKNQELQTMVGELNDLIESMKIQEKGLLEIITNLENKYTASSETEVTLQKEIDVLIEEKKETEEQVKTLETEKSSVLKDLENAMKDLETQKLTIDQIVQEKAELEDAKIQGETEIIKMQEQLNNFKDTILALENSSTDQNEKLKKLEDEVSHYKSSFSQATIEKDEAFKRLEAEEAIKTDFQHKITLMENEIQGLHEDLSKMKTSNMAEKNELEDRCEKLMKDVTILETKLEETRLELDDTKSKLGLAEANSNRVLNILKKTLSGVNEKSVLDKSANGFEEGIKDHVMEVEAIKKVFKDKESRVEEMKRQLEMIKTAAEDARKEKTFWALVSSATTFLAAAVSVAYVARGHY